MVSKKMFGWASSPSQILEDRRRKTNRELRENARQQGELQKTITRLKERFKKTSDPDEQMRIAQAIVETENTLKRKIASARESTQFIGHLEGNMEMAARIDNFKEVATVKSAMARKATPAVIADLQQSIMMSSSTLDITNDMMNDISQPDPVKQEADDEVVRMMVEQLKSSQALDIAQSMPSPVATYVPVPAFPSVPIQVGESSASVPSASPVSVDDFQRRLDNLRMF